MPGRTGSRSTWLRPGSQRFRAEGRQALERLSVDATVVADPPERFRLEVDRTDLGEVAVERVRLTAFHLTGSPGASLTAPMLSVCFVGRGRIRFERPGEAVLGVGDSWVALDGSDIAFGATESSEVLRASTTTARFSAQQLEDCGLPRISTTRTAVSDGLFGLMRGVSDASGRHLGGTEGRAHLSLAIAELMTATVDGLAEGVRQRSDDEADRIRALEYIERHLGDPTTSPDTVAAALHIGRRRLYRLFETDELSIAARIRRRRLDGVVAVIESSPTAPSVRALARQFGFSSTDALARNFRERFGTTVREYHERSARRPA